MSITQTDEEQIEVLKKLWKQYGKIALLVVLVTFGGYFLYNFWQQYHIEKVEKASTLYQALLDKYIPLVNQEEISSEEYQTLDKIISSLKKDYSNTVYDNLATLLQAKLLVEQGDVDQATAVLKQLLSSSPQPEIESVARIRLARLLLNYETEEKQTEALSILDVGKALTAEEYPLLYETRGDVLFALKRERDAKEAYKKALGSTLLGGEKRNLIAIKMDDIAVDEAKDDATENNVNNENS